MTDFTLFQGDWKRLEVTVTGDDGEPIDITNADEIRWGLAKNAKAETPLVLKSLDDGVEIVGGPAGRFDVVIDNPDTLTLRGRYYHEAELIDAQGRVATVLTGFVTVLPALIKPPS